MSFRRRALFLAGLLAAVSCSDAGNPVSPVPGGETPRPPTPADALQSLDCSLSVRGGQLECRASAPSTGGASGLVLGNQNVYVKLTGTNIQTIAPDTTAFDVTVQNLIPQALGVDATGAVDAAGGVRVFFHQEPFASGGSGMVELGNAEGSATFLTEDRPFYQYAGGLDSGEVSLPKTWKLRRDAGVTTIAFKMYVAAQVRWPNGYLRLSPDTAVLDVAQKDTLSADVRNPVGMPQPDAVTFSSSNEAIVTVSPLPGRTAEITAVAKGTAWVRAVSNTHPSRIDSTLVIVDNEPVATPDSVGALSNVTVPVDSAHGMLANDVNDGQLQVIAGTVATAKGGEAVLAENGSFTYLSRSGFSGRDTIHYSVTDGVRTVPGVALVDVEDSNYWYVRAGGTGDGRDSKPFGSVAFAQDSAAAGDTILVLAAGATDLDGAWVLENGQAIVGQGIPASFTRGPFNGATLMVLAAGGAPGMTRTSAGPTVTLAQDNGVAGVGITAANGAAILGNGFGTLTVGQLSLNPAGPALDLTTGTVAGTIDLLSSTNSLTTGVSLTGVGGTIAPTGGAISGAAGTAFAVSGGAGTISYPGSISNTAGLAVGISGRTGGALTLSGAITDSGNGISVSGTTGGTVELSGALALTGKGIAATGNTGGTVSFTGASKSLATGANPAVELTSNTGSAVSFGGGNLQITTTSGAGITGTGGGTFSVTGAGNTITTGTGTALSLIGVGTGGSGVSLFRIEVGAGAAHGIVLNAISGRGVQVTGTAGAPGTAGFIHATTSHRVFLTNTGTAPVVLGPLVMDEALAAGTVALNASGADSIKFDATSIDVSGGAAISAFNSGLYGALQQVRSVGSPNNAVVLNNTAGTVAMPLDLSGAGATTLAVAGGTLNATFTGTAAQATSGALLLNVSGAHSGMLTFGGTLSATNGNGLQFNDADGIYTFSGTTTLNGGNAGIDVTNGSTGALTFGSGTSITNPVGTALDVSNTASGTPSVTDLSYAGTISASAGRPVSVTGVSGGAVSVSGNITATGQGISVASNTGGEISFTGASKSLTTTTNAAVTLTTNPGATITFGGGGLAISTTSGAGFGASGGGTVQVTGAGNTIASTTGIPLSLASVATGASGVNLASVSANGGTNGIVLSDLTGVGVQVNGGTIQATTGNAVSLSNLSGLTSGVQLAGMTLTRTGASNMVLSGSNFGSLDLTGTTVNASGGGRAIDLTTGSVSGTIAAINAAASSGTPVTFTGVGGSATVNGGTIAHGSLVGNLVVSGGSVSLDWRGNLSQATNNVALLRVANGHTGTLTFQTGTLGATDGQGLQFDNADGTYNFNGTTTLSGGDRAIDILNGSAGTFSFASTVSVTNPVATAPALFVDASAPTVTYAGTLSTNAARPVQIEDLTGGAVTVSGGITATGLGILVQNNTAGTPAINFTGTTKSLTTGINAAVTLDNNDAATINFTGGNLAVTTTSGAGFNAVNGGTVNVTGAANVISSGTGTALNVTNTNIGASGLSFQSISANGGANGIVLKSTGVLNGLQVTGNGTNGSGGSITSTAGGDGAEAGNGVYLNAARNVSLNWMALSGHANNAVYGSGVTNVTMNKVRITGNNGTSNSGLFEESPVQLVNSSGTIKITNSRLDGGAWNGFLLRNTTGAPAVDSLVLANDTVSSMQGSTADVRNTGLQAIIDAGSADVRMRNNHLTFWWGNAIQVKVGNSASGTARITNNVINQTSGALAGAGGIGVTGGNLAFNVSGNSVNGANGAAISADKIQGNTFFNGTIDSNTIGTSGVANSGSAAGTGIFVGHSGPNATTIKVSNNTVRQINGTQAVWAMIGDDTGGGGAGTLNATITGNNIAEEGTAASARTGIIVQSGRVAGDTDAMCADVASNSITNFNNRIRPNQRFNTTMRMPGYTGAPGDNAAVNTYLLGRNPGTTNVTSTTTVGGGGIFNTSPANSACPQPSL